jgi:predicted restriction endonuclease
MPRPDRWSREQLIAVYNLYCQLPFGKMDARNRDVIALASAIGRSPNAVALKLVNFASLDPAIRASGRRGMGNVSVADRAIWEEFHGNWNKLVAESQQVLEQIGALKTEEAEISKHTGPLFEEGRTREATIQMRLRQSFFRRSVLSSYRGRCCMSGITDERLLTASHIVPWSLDTTNRLNPRNGLCLSALHDRAFDRFLITVLTDGTIRVSRSIQSPTSSRIMQTALLDLDGKRIEWPERFLPDPLLLSWHNREFDHANI